MNNKPFNILTLLFDLLLSAGTIMIVGIISIIICIAWTGSREGGIGFSSMLALPLATLTFFLVRRQQTIVLTIVQATIATGLLFLWFKFAIDYADLLTTDNSTYLILASIPVVLTLLKHSLDKIVNLTPFAREKQGVG